jgi:hypothetical protein
MRLAAGIERSRLRVELLAMPLSSHGWPTLLFKNKAFAK